jgi:hypothetical protein
MYAETLFTGSTRYRVIATGAGLSTMPDHELAELEHECNRWRNSQSAADLIASWSARPRFQDLALRTIERD